MVFVTKCMILTGWNCFEKIYTLFSFDCILGSHLFKTCEDPTESQHLEVSLLSRQDKKTPVNHRKLSDTFPLSSSNNKNVIYYVRLITSVYISASPNFQINEENYIVLEEKDSIQKDLIAGILTITFSDYKFKILN